MNWIDLTDVKQLDTIKEESKANTILIFKHSTRCNISSLAKNRLDRGTVPENTHCYYLDLIRHRSVSNTIADVFAVPHESPQVLLIKNGECYYEETHNGIHMDEILEQIS